MALEYPYAKQTVVDGVTTVFATQHNHQENQIDELTNTGQTGIGRRPVG